MNSNKGMRQDQDVELAPYQAKLVRDLLESKIPTRQLLVAPPGFGKTIAAMSLVSSLVRGSPKYRILIIGPGALTGMYAHHLAHTLPTAKIVTITGRAFREMEELTEPRKPVWPLPFVGVIGMDTARRVEVLESLCAVKWDLVICEEVHRFARSRWTLLKTILANDTFNRVLLITATPELKGIASLLRKVVKTEWRGPELKDSSGQPLLPSHLPELKHVVFCRSRDELSVLDNVVSLTNELAENEVGNAVKRWLLRQASSSPLALERTVKNLRNTLAHSTSAILLDEKDRSLESIRENDELDMDSSSIPGRSAWTGKVKALQIMSVLLDQIETLDRDTKRESLEGLLESLRRNPSVQSHICVICSSRATANYLKTAISDRGSKTWIFTTENSPEYLKRELDGFEAQGGVLVCTAAQLKGIELRHVDALIHYDPPASEIELYVRVTRSGRADNYLLKDKTDIGKARS
jgi:ERCC4-related helicase